mgnify:CR=1 FL=1
MHVYEVMKANHRALELGARLSRELGTNAYRWLALSGYLHDIGMGIRVFQYDYDGHELASFWIAYRAFQVLNNSIRGLEPFLYGILAHHTGNIDMRLEYWLRRLIVSVEDVDYVIGLLRPLKALEGLDIDYLRDFLINDIDRLWLALRHMVRDVYNNPGYRLGSLIAGAIRMAHDGSYP